MRLLGYLCTLGLALVVNQQVANAQSSADFDAALNEYMDAIASSSEVAMATGCDKKLNDQGTGSECSCSATGRGSKCTCSGSGNQRVCSCTDGTDTTYCYFCSNGSGCECGPTNRSGQKCQGVTQYVVR